LPDIYTLALGHCMSSGIVHIYQANSSLLCYNIYINYVSTYFTEKIATMYRELVKKYKVQKATYGLIILQYLNICFSSSLLVLFPYNLLDNVWRAERNSSNVKY